jgi:hypothetical protein
MRLTGLCSLDEGATLTITAKQKTPNFVVKSGDESDQRVVWHLLCYDESSTIHLLGHEKGLDLSRQASWLP